MGDGSGMGTHAPPSAHSKPCAHALLSAQRVGQLGVVPLQVSGEHAATFDPAAAGMQVPVPHDPQGPHLELQQMPPTQTPASQGELSPQARKGNSQVGPSNPPEQSVPKRTSIERSESKTIEPPHRGDVPDKAVWDQLFPSHSQLSPFPDTTVLPSALSKAIARELVPCWANSSPPSGLVHEFPSHSQVSVSWTIVLARALSKAIKG
jgi:hypothetical protein